MDIASPLKLDRRVPFVDAIFRIMVGSGRESEGVELLLEAEALCEVKFLSVAPSQHPKEIPVERYEEFVENRMNHFLTRTHLVLGSREYSELHVLIADNYTYSWTHREWGHMLAKWANAARWLDRAEWEYLDFYGGLNDRVVENYNAWCATVMKVIETRSKIGT